MDHHIFHTVSDNLFCQHSTGRLSRLGTGEHRVHNHNQVELVPERDIEDTRPVRVPVREHHLQCHTEHNPKHHLRVQRLPLNGEHKFTTQQE